MTEDREIWQGRADEANEAAVTFATSSRFDGDLCPYFAWMHLVDLMACPPETTLDRRLRLDHIARMLGARSWSDFNRSSP
jgi:hypothetical protein